MRRARRHQLLRGLLRAVSLTRLLLVALPVALVAAGACTVRLDLSQPQASPTPGAITVVSSGVDHAEAKAVTSISLTTLSIAAGSGECLVAALALRNKAVSGVSLTWEQQPMSLAVAQTSGGTALIELHQLASPAAGSGTLTASWTGNSDAILGAVAVAGAGPGCLQNSASATGSSSVPSISVTSSSNHLSLAAAVSSESIVSGTGASQWMTGLVSSTARAPVLVQQATHTATAVTTDTVTLASPAQPGHMLVFIGANPSSPLSSVTGGGVTWALATRSAVHANVEIWYGTNPSGSGTSISYTANAASSAWASVTEWANLGALDGASALDGTASPASPGPITTTGSAQVFTACTSDSAPAIGTPSQGPWSAGPALLAGSDNQVEFRRRSAAAMLTPQFTINPAASNWDAAIAAFRSNIPFNVGIGAAASTLPGDISVTHEWSSAASGDWAVVGADLAP